MKTAKLYSGTVTVSLDDAHCYSVDFTEAKPDGVTTILKLVPKYLLPWVAKMTHDDMLRRYLERQKSGEEFDDGWFRASLAEAKNAYNNVRDTAAGIGTEVHAFAEECINLWGQEDFYEHVDQLMPTDKNARAAAEAFLVWLANTRIKPIETERLILSKRLFYCGTCDVFAQTGPDRYGVVDFKTGSGFYEDQPLQLAAYALAIEEELGIEVQDSWIIHLDKKTGKMTPYYVPITKELKTDWEAVRIAWRAVKRNQDRHADIRKAAKEKAKCLPLTSTTQAAAAAL